MNFDSCEYVDSVAEVTELHKRRAKEEAAILEVLTETQKRVDEIATGWTVRAVNPTYAPPPRWLP